ncbi:MAG: hypothetical protein AB1442_11610 [Nitrospirota bacterium]
MKKTGRTFNFYRYQILPKFEERQLELFVPRLEISSMEELISKKNEIFADALKKQGKFSHPRSELTHQMDEVNGFLVLQIGANRSLIRITKDFVPEELDNWPSVHVIINNNPNVQMMAIELEEQAFYRTSTVVHILTTNLNKSLHKYGLVLEIMPIISESEFWKVVRTHKGRVTRVQFFMVAPNLANISKNLALDLGELKNRTNSLHTNLSLAAPSGEALKLSEDDKFTQSLVHYAAEGGGTTHLKIKGLRKIIRTEDSIKSIEVDEIYFSGDDVPIQLVAQLKKVLE